MSNIRGDAPCPQGHVFSTQNFGVTGGKKPGRRFCKVCAHARRAKRRAEAIAYVAWRKDAPCADCGTFYPSYVMDFDHVRGEKWMKLSQLVTRSVTRATLDAEIAKCDLVCANCHRERTQRRRAA